MAVVLALVPATWLVAQRVFDSPDRSGSHTTDLPIPPVSPSTTVTATPSATASATPSRTPSPKPDLPRVGSDAPRRITSGSLLDAGFDNSVTSLDAASSSEVARLESRGSPGSPGTDTVYVIGKVFADGGSAFGDLPKIKPGAKVSIRTDNGTLTYTVSAASLKKESGLAALPLFRTREPGRLVLVGIRYDASGDRLPKALVVTAQLSGAKKA